MDVGCPCRSGTFCSGSGTEFERGVVGEPGYHALVGKLLEWIGKAMHLISLLFPCEVRAFALADESAAIGWASEGK